MTTLSERIKAVRAARGMTQRAVAARARMKLSTYTKIEQGRVDPRWSNVVAVADALGASLDELRDNRRHEEDDEDPDVLGVSWS